MMTFQRTALDPQLHVRGATISTVAFGPCWCRAVPGDDGSFDVFRQRTVRSPLGRDVLVVTDRVPPSGVATVRRLLDSLADPLVITTKACPAANWYWDTSPSGWVEASDLVHVDTHVGACLTGHPEMLFTTLLGIGERAPTESYLTALTGAI